MTVTNRLNRATIDGNGVSTVLSIEFPFHSVEDLVVIQTVIATGVETPQVLNTDYTVIGAQDDAGHYPTGGEIVFTVAPASTVRMTAYRDPPMLQEVVLIETGKIPVKAAIESPLDKLTMIDQRLSERIDRALRLSDGDSLEMGRLPVKGVRASRYLGFDGDGNPTMMTTPQGVLTPISQLTESLISALPAAGSAGSLRKVTDGVRGIWMDTGTRWVPLNRDIINAREFLAGDGSDERATIQAMIDTGKDIYFGPPPVAYGVGSALTLSTSYQRLYGAGGRSVIKCLSAGFNLFAPSADLVGLEIFDLRALGAATSDAVQQYFLFTTTALQIQRSIIRNVILSGPDASTGFNNGILFDRDSDENTVEGCLIERLVGITSGHGYAVQLGDSHHHRVAHNRFIGAAGTSGRHAVYVGTGSSYNHIVGNRVTDYTNIPLLLYALSTQANGRFNTIESNTIVGGTSSSSENGAIHVDGWVSDNLITGNVITGFGRNGILVTDGGQGGLCEHNVVQGNTVVDAGQVGIYLIGTKGTRVLGNTVIDASAASSGTSNGIDVRSAGTFGTEEDEHSVVIGNTSRGAGQRSALAIDSGAPAPSGTIVKGNDLGTGTIAAYSFKGLVCSGDDIARFTEAVATNVAIAAVGAIKTFVSITGVDGTNMTVDAPTEAREGKELTITIRNNSGGSLGTCTFAAGYKTTGSWTQPGNGKSRSIVFVYDGTNWIEQFRSAADVNL